MGKRTVEDEGDDEEDGDSFEDYTPEYHPEADEAGEFWCPKCGAEMYGDSTRCATCGDYVTPGARPSMPWWIWLGILFVGVGLLAGLAAAFRS